MRDDIEKFRKLAKTLISGENLSKDDILRTMEISAPTLEKLLHENLATIKVQASILGKVQDFNKNYSSYQGIEEAPPPRSAKVKEKDLDDAIKAARELLEEAPPVCADKTIWTMLRELEKALPKNMSIQLIINSRK